MRIPDLAILAVLAACPACQGGPSSGPRPGPTPIGPYVLVLGTAQDGGLPQIGCEAEPCVRARRDGSARRLVSSLLLADPRASKRWLFDASPSLPEQVERMRGHPPSREAGGARRRLVDGLFLTHAHVGHYAGLIHLGREVREAHGLPTFVSPRMGRFLETNGPWSLMVRNQNLALLALEPGRPHPLGGDLSVRAVSVPHRDEFSDTLAFVIRGPRRSLLYLPDIDKWERWEVAIEELIAEVDFALLDGTFFSDGELPGRAMAEIPHPFIAESLERFAALPPEQRAKVFFTHLNHTNPAADPSGPEAARIRAAGMSVAAEGQVFEL